MTTNTHNERWSHRLGRRAGHAWRGYRRREQRAAGWLVARGVPAGAATALLWLAKLLVLGVLLYAAFWLVLLFLFAVAAAWAVQNGALDGDGERPDFVEDELSRLRKTPGYDPNPYNDSAHEMYTDD